MLKTTPLPGVSLTSKQAAVLEYLVGSTLENGYQPSSRDFMKKFGWNSPHSATVILNAIRRKGYVTFHPKRSRGVEIVNWQAIQLIYALTGRVVLMRPDHSLPKYTTRMVEGAWRVVGPEDEVYGRIFENRHEAMCNARFRKVSHYLSSV